MLGLKLNHVIKSGHWILCYEIARDTVNTPVKYDYIIIILLGLTYVSDGKYTW